MSKINDEMKMFHYFNFGAVIVPDLQDAWKVKIRTTRISKVESRKRDLELPKFCKAFAFSFDSHFLILMNRISSIFYYKNVTV